MDDGELPAMIEMVKTGRGNRLERFAVRLVLGEHQARPNLMRDPAGLCCLNVETGRGRVEAGSCLQAC